MALPRCDASVIWREVDASAVNITPTHNAVWSYAEWCCEHGRSWPKLATVAADIGRNVTTVERAFADLEAWGVLARRASSSRQFVVRLGDGRETAPVTHTIHKRRKRAIWPPARYDRRSETSESIA